jgi:phosphatidate cytidylyltransferase
LSELAKRVAVAAVGIPAVLALVYLGGWFLALPLAALAVLGVLELDRIAKAVGVRPLTVLAGAGAAALVLLAAWHPSFATYAPWALATLGLVAASSILGALWRRGPTDRPLESAGVTLFGVAYVGLPLSFVPLLLALPTGRSWAASGGDAWAGLAVIALPLASTWVGDACAYFAGSAWGKAKLAPSISPNKSWVGFWADLAGGAAAAAAWYALAAPVVPGLALGLPVVLSIGALLGLGAVVGDLAESLLKRQAGVKDSGTFFPGHGGVLDRLDALLVTLPLAYVALALLGDGG